MGKDGYPARKGSNRSKDLHKGYHSNKDGKSNTNHGNNPPLKDPKGKAYPAELKDKYKLCPECNNKDEKGHPVLGHGKGFLQCWKVHKGLLKAHPMFKKHASTYPNLKFYDPPKKGASKGRPALIHLVDSSGACCPILMVNDDDANQDTGPQTRLPPPGYGQNQLAIPLTLPVNQPHQLVEFLIQLIHYHGDLHKLWYQQLRRCMTLEA